MRGKVTFSAAGQDHALRFTTNRLCQLEADTSLTVMDFAAKLEKPETMTFVDVRILFHCGLVGEHSLDAAGDLIDEIGMKVALGLVVQALSAAFDSGAEKRGKGGAGAGKTSAGAV